ncbi:MFS transporter [Serratia ureilytica]
MFGLLIGSLLFGPIADAIGRKRVLLVAVLVFGAAARASAYTHSIESLTLLRFITGIGLGARYRPASPSARVLTGAPPHADGHPRAERLYRGGLAACWPGRSFPAFGWRGVLLVGGIARRWRCCRCWPGKCPNRALYGRQRRMPIGCAGWSSVSPAKCWTGITIVDDEPGTGQVADLAPVYRRARRAHTAAVGGVLLLAVRVLPAHQLAADVLKDAGYDIVHASRIGAMVPLGGTTGAIPMARC